MDKKTLLAVVISIAILLSYNALISKLMPRKGPVAPIQSQQIDTNESVAKSDSYVPVLTSEPIDQNIVADDFIEFEIEPYRVKVSLLQGSITEIFLKEYQANLQVTNFLASSPPLPNVSYTASLQGKTIAIIGRKNSNVVIEKKVTFNDDYSVDAAIKTFETIPSDTSILIQIQKDKDAYASRYQEVFYKKDLIKRIPLHSIKKEISIDNINFIGYRGNYYCLSLINSMYSNTFKINTLSQYIVQILLPFNTIDTTYSFFIGPQKSTLLKKYKIDEIINYGFFHMFSVWILYLLNFLFSISHNWGLSIILTTIIINLALLPLTTRSTKAMKAMQAVQGEIEVLKEKYKDNPQKLNKEVIELYKIHKVNPLSGCLPWLLQIPFFFGFFQILNRFVQIKNAHFLWISDLTQPDHFYTLPFTLPMNYGNQLNLLPIILIFVMYFQQKITTGNTASQNDQQKMLMIVLPVVMGVIFYKFSAALALYWLTNSITMAFFQYKFLKK